MIKKNFNHQQNRVKGLKYLYLLCLAVFVSGIIFIFSDNHAAAKKTGEPKWLLIANFSDNEYIYLDTNSIKKDKKSGKRHYRTKFEPGKSTKENFKQNYQGAEYAYTYAKLNCMAKDFTIYQIETYKGKKLLSKHEVTTKGKIAGEDLTAIYNYVCFGKKPKKTYYKRGAIK